MTFSVLGTDSFNNKITIDEKIPPRRAVYYRVNRQGKTVLLETLIMQELTQGVGICVLGPHRDLTRRIIELMPQNRLQDVILLDIANSDYVFGLNLYTCLNPSSPEEVQYGSQGFSPTPSLGLFAQLIGTFSTGWFFVRY